MAYIYRRWSLLWISCNISMFYNLYIHMGKKLFCPFLVFCCLSAAENLLEVKWRWWFLPFFTFFCSLMVSEDFFLMSALAFLYSEQKQKVRKLLSLPKCLWVRASLLTYLWRGLYPADWPLFSTPPFSTQEVWWDLLRGTWGQKEI